MRAEASGYVVTEVWQSKASFEMFFNNKVLPISEILGVGEPQLKFTDVASYCTAGG